MDKKFIVVKIVLTRFKNYAIIRKLNMTKKKQLTPPNNLTEVVSVKCPKCKDTVYSRTRHDMRFCTCESISIDGGFDYVKVSNSINKPIKTKKLLIPYTKEELYIDWNYRRDNLGLIKGD